MAEEEGHDNEPSFGLHVPDSLPRDVVGLNDQPGGLGARQIPAMSTARERHTKIWAASRSVAEEEGHGDELLAATTSRLQASSSSSFAVSFRERSQ